MGGHVVGPLGRVHDPLHAFGRQPPEKAVEVSFDIVVGIFLDQQGTRGVSHEDGQQTRRDIGSCYELTNSGRELIEALPLRRYGEGVHGLLHSLGLPCSAVPVQAHPGQNRPVRRIGATIGLPQAAGPIRGNHRQPETFGAWAGKSITDLVFRSIQFTFRMVT
ncbi:hypothetical protein FQZ97_1050640 [compost metagenome]